MRLVYAVTGRSPGSICMTEERPDSGVYSGEGEKMVWKNPVQQFGPYKEIGQHTQYWNSNKPGELLGVYDRDNLQHLANLAFLYYEMTESIRRSRIPSRDT